MADIIITPGSSLMSFTSSLNYTQTLAQEASGSLTLQGSGSTGRTDIFTVNGNNGTLFSVSDDLSNSLFSVNTIAGLPVIEAFADNTVVMGQYGQNVLVVTGSNVGIGTTTPINAAGYTTLTVNGSSGGQITWNTANSKVGAIYNSSTALNIFSSTGVPIRFEAGNAERMRLAANGDLLVGTQTSIHGISGRGVIQINGSSTAILSLSTGDADAGYIYHTGTNMYLWNYKNGAMFLGTSNVERITILAGGNVGIGTTSPSRKLDVVGTFGTSGDATFNGTYTNINSSYITIGNDATDVVGVAGSTMYFPGTGKVGIGNTSPGATLTVGTQSSGTGGSGVANDNSIIGRFGAANTAARVVGLTIANTATSTVGNDSTLSFIVAGNYSATGLISTILQNTSTAASDMAFSVYSNSMQERMRITSAGNVGIGTTSPAQKLEVVGVTRLKDTNANPLELNRGLDVDSVGPAGVGMSFGALKTGVYKPSAYIFGSLASNGTDGTFGIQTRGGDVLTTKLTITSTGNVGIGTTSPSARLDLASFSGEFIRLNDGSATGSPYISFFQLNTRRSYIQHVDSGDNLTLASEYGGIALLTGTGGTETEKMRITSAGNVGIGTTSPAQKLHVDGTVITTSTLNDTDGSYTIDHPGINTWKMGVTSTNSSTFHIGNDTGGSFANKILNITAAGNVGIGTTSPSAKLHLLQSNTSNTANLFSIEHNTTFWGQTFTNTDFVVKSSGNIGLGTDNPGYRLDVNGTLHSSDITIADAIYHEGDTNTYIQFVANDTIRWVTSGTERMRLNSSGNVGIGTTSPTQKLEVNGNIKLSSTAGGTSTPSYIWLGNDFSNGTTRDKLKVYLYNSGTEQYGFTAGSSGDIQYHSNAIHDFYINNSFSTRINSTGVGIGTTSPAFPLDVNGSTNIKGSITGQDSSNNYRYEFAPELAYTRVGVGGVGTYKINSGAVTTTSMLRIKSTSTSGWLSSDASYFNGTVISDGLSADTIPTAGTLVFLTTDGEWGIADADVGAKSIPLLGIALNSTSGIGETVDVLIDGIIALKSNHDQISIPASAGAPIYVSTNAGNVTEVAPSGTGDIVRLVGHNVWSATSPQNTAIIKFQPDNTWIEL